MHRVKAAILLVAASASVSLLFAELVLRWRIGPPVHFVHPQVRYVDDAELGPWMEPNQNTFNHHHPLATNSVGIRGPDRPFETAAGVARVLALGDSQTFGNGLPDGETWPQLLEDELISANDSVRWEVVNAGVAGTDTWQHERILGRLADHYAFDAVVLGFYVNDVTVPYATTSARERTNTASKRLAYLVKRSAVLTAVLQAGQRLTHKRYGAREAKILSGEPHKGIEQAWAQVELSLAAMKRRIDESQAPFLLLVIPRRDQVASTAGHSAYHRKIVEISARLGIEPVDPLEPLRAAFAEHGTDLFIPWDGHYTATANDVMAKEVARRLAGRATSRGVLGQPNSDPQTLDAATP